MTGILCHRFEPPPVAAADAAALARAWCAHLAPVFAVRFGPDTDLSGPIGMTSYHLGDLIVGETVAPAQTLERSARMAAQQGLDHLLLQFHRSGHSRIRTERRKAPERGLDTDRSLGTAGAGQCVVLDLAQPVLIEAAPVTATFLVIPRGLIADQAGAVDRLHGLTFDPDGDPVTRLLHTVLQSLVAAGDTLDAQHLPGVTQALAKLCGTCLAGWPMPGRADGPATDQRIAFEVRRYIQRELASRRLDVEAITARFGLSRATLYRQFADDGGVQSYIRDQRLMRAMKMLTRTGPGGRPRISAVAYAAGFSDEKTFSRAFKRRYGFLPREADAGDVAWPGTSDDASVLRTWISNLAA